jgi:hypothetical protein
MTAEVSGPVVPGVVKAVKAGDVELHNPGQSRREHAASLVLKGINYVSAGGDL